MPPGTMKRVSIRFSRTDAGHLRATTSGRRSSETKQAAGVGLVGRVGQHHVGLAAARRRGPSSRAKTALGTAILSSGIGRPPSAMWKTPGGGAAVVRGVVQHAVDEPVAAQQRRAEVVAVEGQRQLAGQARLVEHQGAPGQPRLLAGVGEVVVEEGLDAAGRRRTAGRTAGGSARAAGRGSAGPAWRRRCPRTPAAGAGPSWASRRLMAAFWVWGTTRLSSSPNPAPPPRSGNGPTPGPATCRTGGRENDNPGASTCRTGV